MYNLGLYSIAEGKQITYAIINTIILVTEAECLCLLHITQGC